MWSKGFHYEKTTNKVCLSSTKRRVGGSKCFLNVPFKTLIRSLIDNYV